MMKVMRADLLRAVKLACLVAEAKSTIPALTMVNLSSKDGAMTVQVRGLDAWLRTHFDGEGDDLPESLVGANRLRKLLSAMTSQVVTLARLDDGRLEVATPERDSISRMMTTPVADQPETFAEVGNATFKTRLPMGVLQATLGAVASAISSEETRYYLNGICVQLEGSTLTATATDGHRLLHRRVAMAEGSHSGEIAAGHIIPHYAIKVIRALSLTESDADLSFYPSGKSAGAAVFGKVRQAKTSVMFKLIDGMYPDWRRVVPKEQTAYVEVDSASLFKAAHIVKATSDGRGLAVLAINGEAVGVRMAGPGGESLWERGDDKRMKVKESVAEDEAFSIVKGRVVGQLPAPAIGFNVSYIADMIAAMGPGLVRLYTGHPGDPIRVEGPASGLGVLMPMRASAGLNWRPELTA